MKKIILLIAIVISLTSCLKEKLFLCECTYVPSSINYPVGTPNKVETNTVKGYNTADADGNCNFDGKYSNQFYQGTCLIK
jgi:hypothetical protein